MARPTFYYDISSVYAYMAAERIGDLLPDADWQPIFLGGLFKLNGRTSWILSEEREARMAEIEERAGRYGLPPIAWPPALPENLLALARAATVAKRMGREQAFALAGFRAIYVDGLDPSAPTGMRQVATTAGLDPDEVIRAIADQAVKDELRATTDEAHERGAPGVPTIVVNERAFWGDDRLEEAVSAATTSDDVDLVRRGYEAYESDGIEGILRFLDPAVEWRNPPDSPIAGVFHGHDGVREWQRLTDEVFAELHFWPKEFIEAPDGRVLAICDARVRGRESEVVVDVPFAHVLEVRGGKVVAFQMFSQVADGRRAVGLME